MHTLLDYDGHLPAYVDITDVKTADNKGVYGILLLIQLLFEFTVKSTPFLFLKFI